MASNPQDFVIDNLRGGLNVEEPPNAINDDECVIAENVEFFNSTLGERRRGMEAVDLAGSDLADETEISHLSPHYPRGEEFKNAVLFAVGATQNTSITISYRSGGVWTDVTPIDEPSSDYPDPMKIYSQSLHGKWNVAYKSVGDVDRLHVWDGTSLRRTGLAAPGVPTVTDSPGAGTFSGDRIYRVRVIEMDGEDILRRSEPSEEVTFSPSGSNDGAVVTIPVDLPGEGETDWEIEASDGDGNFYIIATVSIGTATYTDTTDPATDYAEFILSADIGDYSLIPSVKFVKADQDRLIFGGSWHRPEEDSRISWTPVYNDPGVGNDERIPLDTDNFIDLDWGDGGGLTGLSSPVNGSFYAFKWARIYKVMRTGTLEAAYEAAILSSSHGALEGSIVNGHDEYGRACVYFLDPAVGPMRVGSMGLQRIHGLGGEFWKRVNTAAAYLVSHGMYYPDKEQLHWWVALDGNDAPTTKLVLQCSEIRSEGNDAWRGWSTTTGDIGLAWCSSGYSEVIFEASTGSESVTFRPYAGFSHPYRLQRCDMGDTDDGTEYYARIRTKPFILMGLLNKWAAMTAALLAKAIDDVTTTIEVKMIRDFGKETNKITTDFVPYENEDPVIKIFDDLKMAEATAIQIEFADPNLPTASSPFGE